jgi:hypothetical protein
MIGGPLGTTMVFRPLESVFSVALNGRTAAVLAALTGAAETGRESDASSIGADSASAFGMTGA